MRQPSRLVFAMALACTLALAGGVATALAPSSPTPPAAGRRPAVTKLLVVVEENHSFNQMAAGMPYAFALARRYGYATNYHAITHPSLPNYLAIVAGFEFGVTDDGLPAQHRLAGASVFGQARARGGSAATYAESMPVACARNKSGPYQVKHNPWTYFGERAPGLSASDRGMPVFYACGPRRRLPRVGLVVPNGCHDGHDCSLATVDAWFRSLMANVFAGRDWRSGRLAVVLTGDEANGSQGNRVLTVVIHPSQRHRVVTRPLTHYSLARLYAEVAGLPPLRNARTAPSMATAFGLPVR